VAVAHKDNKMKIN